MTPELQTTIASILQGLQKGVAEYGPQAYEVALGLRRLQGIQHLINGGVALLMMLIVLGLFRRYFLTRPLGPQDQARLEYLSEKGYHQRSAAEDNELARLHGGWAGGFNDDHTGHLVGAACGAVVLVFAFVVMCDELFDIWNWTALFRPDIALAHDIFVKVLR